MTSARFAPITAPMDLELDGRVAIGGASKGLGRACAQALAREGAKVAVCSRSKPDLDKAATEIRDTTGADVLAFAGDLDRQETIHGLIAAKGVSTIDPQRRLPGDCCPDAIACGKRRDAVV